MIKMTNFKFKGKMKDIEYRYGYFAGCVIGIMSLLFTQLVITLIIFFVFKFLFIILFLSFLFNGYLSAKIIMYFIKKAINKEGVKNDFKSKE